MIEKLLAMAAGDATQRTALKQLPETFFDVSSDLLLSAYGTILGVIFVLYRQPATADPNAPKQSQPTLGGITFGQLKDIFFVSLVLFVMTFLIFLFTLVVPAAQWSLFFNAFWTIIVPDALGLVALGLAVRVAL
ncbi:MAG TPA: hypothetical protein VLX09_23795 [Stellaceae bacterium]|nr:hypothetical protein [Stellaceae bacterium]